MAEHNCRRCSECQGMSHHWMDDPVDPGDDEFEPGDYACKHCDERGNGCERCAGDGRLFNDDDKFEEDSPLCPDCKGEGVIPMDEQEYHEIMQAWALGKRLN